MTTTLRDSIKLELDNISTKKAETEQLLTKQTALIDLTIIRTGQTLRSLLLVELCSNPHNTILSTVTLESDKIFNVEAKREGFKLIIHPDNYQIRYEIEFNYQSYPLDDNIEYETNEPYLIVNPSGRSYGKEHSLSYKIAGLILIDIADKSKFYKQIMSSFAYITELIAQETALTDQLKQYKQQQTLYIEKLNYAEFDLKLVPMNVIITHQKLKVIIHRVTADTVLVSCADASLDKHSAGEKYRMHKSTLYKQCTHRYEQWRVLTKAEYVEEFI